MSLETLMLGALLAGAPIDAAGASVAADAGLTVEPDSAADVRTVTLEDVVTRARASATDSMRTKARVALGDAEQEATAPLFPENPTVSLGVGGRASPLGANLELQAQLSQPLEFMGERRLRRRSALAYRHSLVQQHALARWHAEVDARAAFYRALVEERRARAAATAVAFSKTVVETTRVLVEAGEESPLRLRLAEGELAQALQAHQDAGFRYRAACNRMAELAGWPLGQDIRPRGRLPAPRREPRAAEPTNDHPAVAAAQAEVEAARAARRSARRDALPHPSVGVYLAQEQEPGTPWASQVALGTISLPLPLWRRNQGPRARAEARLRIADNERTVVTRDLKRRAQRAHDALGTAALRLQTYSDEVLPRFSENLDLVRRAFELGEIDIIEVFVARERFMRMQDQALDVYLDYVEAMRQLEHATGVEAGPRLTTGTDRRSADP